MARRSYSPVRRRSNGIRSGGIRSGYSAMRTYNTIKRVQRHGLQGFLIRLINLWIGRAVWHSTKGLYMRYPKTRKP
jgi:hypothetical protein